MAKDTSESNTSQDEQKPLVEDASQEGSDDEKSLDSLIPDAAPEVNPSSDNGEDDENNGSAEGDGEAAIETGNGDGAGAGGSDHHHNHLSGLTHESSFSEEYEEDLFPESLEEEEEEKESLPEEEVGRTSSSHRGSSSHHHSSRNSLGASVHSTATKSVEVSERVWARTWEERAKEFQKAHPEEFQAIEKKMKQKDILKIEDERTQRLFENKVFANVDSFFKIVASAFCSVICLTILLCIILAVILKGDVKVPDAPTAPPLAPSPTMAPTVAAAPSMVPTVLSTTAAPRRQRQLRTLETVFDP